MQELVDKYLAFVQKRSRSRKTYITYTGCLETFRRIVGDMQLTKEAYIKFLENSTHMKPATQALHRSAIKGLYGYWSDKLPGVDISFFEQANQRYALKLDNAPIMFNREGIEKTIQYVNAIRKDVADLRDRTFILLLADSGLRVSEACGIRLGDIDWLEQRIAVTGKGNKPAIVKMSNRVTEAAKEYLQAREHTGKSVPLFIQHSKKAGNRMVKASPGVMWFAVKRRIGEAGVDPETIRIHDFRHYFVTIVYHAKGIKMAQTLARHKVIGTTDRYTHLVENEDEAYDEIFNH